MSLRLVIFDVDGTLVDSQGDIHASMHRAFAAEGLTPPDRAAVRAIVGLSLPQAIARLAPETSPEVQARVVDGYKGQYFRSRQAKGAAAASPLFPGAAEAIAALHARDEVLLATATGKSRRGLTFLLDAHGLTQRFVSTQVADDHPSKPHPSMVLTALSETGVAPEDAVVVGDTTFDMDMAHGAGVPFIGVAWGYHPPDQFSRALTVLQDFADLPPFLDTHWSLAG